MKLASIALKNFRRHRDSQLALAPLTVICGKNDQGKSTVGEALVWCLTGRARDTDKRGAGADTIITNGEESMGVRLLGERDGVDFVATRQKLRGQNAKLTGIPEFDADLVQAVLESPHFLSLDEKRRAELLLVASGAKLTVGEFLAEGAAMRLSDSAVALIRNGIAKRTVGELTDASPVTPSMLDDLHSAAYENRKAVKRELQDLERSPVAAPLVDAPVPTEEEISAAREALEAIENEGFDLRTRNGVALEAARAQGRLIEEEKRLRTKLEALPKPETGEAVQLELGAGPTVEQLQEALKQAEGFERGFREVAETRASELKERQQEEASLRARADGAPLACDGTIGKGSVCPLAPKPEPVTPAKLSAAQTRLGAAMTAERRAKADLSAAMQATEAARTALTTAKEAAARSAGATEAQRTALEDQIQQLAIQIEAAGDTTTIVSQLDQALIDNARTKAEAQRLVDSKVYVGQRRRSWDEYSAKLKTTQAEVDLFEALVKALEPRGILSRLLGRKLEAFVTHVNAVLSSIADYEVTLRIENGVQVEIRREGTAGVLGAQSLGDSAQLRLGVSIGAAISAVSGLGILVVDRVDTLLADLRGKLMQALTDPSVGLENVVLILSREDAPFTSDESTAVYWVENWGVRRVEQAQEVLN